jgi:hypothetical protein
MAFTLFLVSGLTLGLSEIARETVAIDSFKALAKSSSLTLELLL